MEGIRMKTEKSGNIEKNGNMEKRVVLQTEGLSYEYEPGKPAISRVSVSFYQGEKVAILGANGAGKSTFFLTMNGVLHPSAGQIILHGNPITGNKKDRRTLHKEVGIVFQDADNQMIASTVKQEVSFGPMNLKLSKEEVMKRTMEAMEYMNLRDYEERPPHSLSGGEKKRVSIADVIAMEGAVIAFDEPTASLDPVNAQMLEAVLERLSGEEKTLLVSTHDVDFAYRWADRILVFDKGQIAADGTPIQVFENDALLEKCNLKKPTILTVYDIMKRHGVLSEERISKEGIPRTTDAMERLLG